MIYIDRIARRLHIKRYLLVKYLIDLLLWTVATPAAFLLRVGDSIGSYRQEIVGYTLLGLALKAAIIYSLSLHRQSWHKVGIRDLFWIIRASAFSTVIMLAVGFLLFTVLPVPRSIPLIDGLLGITLLGGSRLALRMLNERSLGALSSRPRRRVLIVGAGEAGTMMAREMLRHPESGMYPVGFLDDEQSKQQRTYLGLPVVGSIDDLPTQVHRLNIHDILIAIPSAPGDIVRRVVALAREADVRYRIIPGFHHILSGEVSISQIRDVAVEDLLRRDPIQLNLEQIAKYLENHTILVTGAGGSIGSEIVRQIIPFNPGQIVLLDRDENSLYVFERELENFDISSDITLVVADIQRKAKLSRIFEQYQPDVVFHAAANKHVPLMEEFPEEAVLNNVMGTQNMLDVSLASGVERFVNISTDKAVKPSSVMGVSKRIAELLVDRAAQKTKANQAFVSVRFGNVLGSNASVVPIFKDQIRKGGPVTVTHPEMTRYFMSIPEATQLVLQAAALGENNTIYILDMGEPVKIDELARDLIQLSGLQPDVDIVIQYTQPRAGEKLSEELLTAEEGAVTTRHEKIYIVPRKYSANADFDSLIEQLIEAAQQGNSDQLRRIFSSLIPSYVSAQSIQQ